MSADVVTLDRFEKREQVQTQDEIQLSFEFCQNEKSNKLTIVVMETVHGLDFCNLVSDLVPKIILDMRLSVRFDLPGSSRDHIFNQFKRSRALYSRASLNWHDLTHSDFMLGENSLSNRLNHELLEREESPLLILVQKPSHAQLLHSFVNRQLKGNGKENWSVGHCA